MSIELLNDLRNDTCTNSLTAFTNREVKTLLHCNWRKKLDAKGNSVTRDNQFLVSWKLDFTSRSRDTRMHCRNL